MHRQVVRKDAGRLEVPVDPVLALHYVEVDEPTMVDAIGDLQRLRAALAEEWQLTGLEVDHSVLTALQPALERGKRGVTVAVRSGRDVVAVWPGLRDRVYGVAFDVGSTTLAGHLCDLFSGEVLASAGRMNPQISFGEDLMSRVSYVMMHPGGDVQLTAVVREALAAMIAELGSRGRRRPGRGARDQPGGEPDHASPGVRAGPPTARVGAVRAGHHGVGDGAGLDARSRRASGCPGLLAALHRRARRRRRGRDGARRRRRTTVTR